LDEVDRWVAEGVKGYATLTGVHGLMEARRDPAVGRAYNEADLSLPDGMPLVWLLWQAGFDKADRVYGPDLMLALFEHSVDRGYRHYLYGSSPRVLAVLEERLRQRFPGVQIVGSHSPPMRPAGALEDPAVLDEINAVRPDILWVGLGAPKQDLWMARHRPLLNAAALFGVGAAFDFHAGLLRQAPRWIQRAGLEWAFRMAMEPKRLAKRYLFNIPPFVLMVAAQKLGFRR
jgi:N-acetylglucosaminyldiphosphoundecaprenol N-acetyl-beta-D-mannosaminyltransferase